MVILSVQTSFLALNAREKVYGGPVFLKLFLTEMKEEINKTIKRERAYNSLYVRATYRNTVQYVSRKGKNEILLIYCKTLGNSFT